MFTFAPGTDRLACPRTRLHGGFFTRFRIWLRMRREVKAIRTLDAHMLDDIGLLRGPDEPRPKWDVPPHWRA